jgi:two-component system, OmpR family, copper resistance phosphate regulon response regulator CusR
VDVANEGNQGRAMAMEFDYDLVVLDLNLPGVDGLSVLKSLRQRKANLPVMILTARCRVEDRVQCLDSGADDYMVKPFSYLELSDEARSGRGNVNISISTNVAQGQDCDCQPCARNRRSIAGVRRRR